MDSYKSKGPTDLMPSYRSILLNNTIAKHHHRFLRDRALAVFGHLLRPTQRGGLPGKGVDMAPLILRTFAASVKRGGRTAFVL